MVCLDTDILVGLLRNDKDAVKKISQIENGGLSLSTTSITACELFKGAFRSTHKEENVELIENLLNNLTILNFGISAAKSVGYIIEELRKKGRLISELDCMIAGIVIANNELLLTRNIKHFKKISGLRVEIW